MFGFVASFGTISVSQKIHKSLLNLFITFTIMMLFWALGSPFWAPYYCSVKQNSCSWYCLNGHIFSWWKPGCQKWLMYLIFEFFHGEKGKHCRISNIKSWISLPVGSYVNAPSTFQVIALRPSSLFCVDMTDGERAVRLYKIPQLTYKCRTGIPLQRIKESIFCVVWYVCFSNRSTPWIIWTTNIFHWITGCQVNNC